MRPHPQLKQFKNSADFPPVLAMHSFLPPATKLLQGNVFTLVCHSAHGGGCLSPTSREDTPPRQTPPGHTLPLGRHTPPPGQTHPSPWAGTPPVQCMLGYSQQAGVTHPTGMHSCNVTISFRHFQCRTQIVVQIYLNFENKYKAAKVLATCLSNG